MPTVSELGGLVLLLVGLGALSATGGLLAACLRLRSPIAFLLAAYVIAWGWLVTVSLALSPARWLTRGALLGALAVGLGVAVVVWSACGRPAPPRVREALAAARDAFRHPAVLVLGIAVALGTVYIGALAFFTPANDWDALAYHVARASFWRQQAGVAYVADVPDWRVNLAPPNAEIGQLATMLVSGRDRYTALPQLLAYAAIALCVAGLARRIGLSVGEALFGALAVATLPVVALQATGSLNDLVVASFLTAAAYFALGGSRASLLLLALSIALAVGTKYTTLLALPTLVVVAAVAQPRRRWPALLLAGIGGALAGSAWYVVTLVETGGLFPDTSGQRAEQDVAPVLLTALRLGISFIDMSGGDWPHSLVYLIPAGVLAVAGGLAYRRSRGWALALLAAAVWTAAVVAMPVIWELAERPVYRLGLALGRRDVVTELGWGLNTKAEPTIAWYGPLVPLLLVLGSVAVILAWRHGRLPSAALALAAAPWLLLVTMALVLAWDVWRGRLLLFGVALGAATWGIMLRWRATALAASAIGSTALFLALANYDGKPAGLFSDLSIWGTPRWQAQIRFAETDHVLRYTEDEIPSDAQLGLSLVADDYIHPYFGPRLSRQVTIVRADGGVPPSGADWLVLAPFTRVRRCPDAWRHEFFHNGWRVERRLAADRCAEVPE
jgi:hypothetical protein